MLKPPSPANEIERLQALHALDVLDTPAEERFDRLTRIAQYVLQVPIALVSLVDAERQWFKSRQGLEASETPRDISFCGHAVLGAEVFVVPDAAADTRFADNPLVLEAPHIRFYAGAPLTLSNGLRVGTLCAIDRQPHRVTDEQLAVLRDLAQCVSEELERGQQMERARELVLLQARYSAIIAASDDAIISKTLDGIITTWNPAAEKLFGYPAAAAIGQPMTMLYPPEFVGEEPEIIARIGRGERVAHFETVWLKKDGSRIHVSVSTSPVADASGRIVGASKIVRDISARKQAEAELAGRIHELNERVKEQRCLYQIADLARDAALSQKVFLERAVSALPPAWQYPDVACARIVVDDAQYHSGNFATSPWQMTAPITLSGAARGRVEVIYRADMPAADEGPFLAQERRLLDVVAGQIGQTLEHYQAEEAARASLQLIKSILDTVVDGIITIDSQGTVLSCNPATERLFGYTQAEMINRKLSGLMPEPYAAEHDAYVARYLKTCEARVIGIGREATGRRKDGSTFPLELAVSEMPQADRTLFVGIVRDITERKQMERMKSEFVSTVSHELRTPLTSIRGALGLVLGKYSSGLPDKARQLLDTANRNSERLTLLINDILDLEKIESGRLEFELMATDLVAVAQQAMVANEGYGQQHDVLLRLVATPARALVQADEHRLLQVFANLISNAVKYSPAGGTVDVALGWQEGRFRVSVRDHGPGIPAAFRSRMFQRFAQADSSDTRQKGGTGLGLSITRAIVERLGGSIGFNSEEGVGTEFYFELPEWREIIEQSSGASDRPTMLICEDNADVAMVLADLLEQEGVASDRVATAAAALEMLKRKPYRALLLDLGLPDMDGLTLIQRLRSDEATRKLPVIVVSGRAREDTAAWDGHALSVLDWLQKPVDRERLGQALNQALQSQRRPHILHVEDDTDIIQITQALLEEDADYTYATSLAAARLALAQSHCDLLLLDLTLPDGSGLELLDAISPDTKVIVFSGQDPGAALRQHVTAALIKGATSSDRLLATIKQVINQERS